MLEKSQAIDGQAAALSASNGLDAQVKAPHMRYAVECHGPDGALKWREEFDNLVTTVGKNDLLDKYFKGSTYTAAWYVGLIDNAGFTAVAAGDTMASHAGWTEAVGYSGANRATLTLGTPAGGSVDNSAAKASFAISGTATIYGAFVTSAQAKGGTTGILYSAGDFSAPRAVQNGDTLSITNTLSFT